MEQSQWKKVFAEQLSSGLSVRKFCLSKNIKQKTFYTKRSAMGLSPHQIKPAIMAEAQSAFIKAELKAESLTVVIENTIKQASMPATPIPKSCASSSLLAQIILAIYQYSLPLYRQEAIFSQFNIELNRKTMSDWIIKSAQLLTPLYDKLKQRLLTQRIIQTDETSLTLINNDKVKSYLRVYCCGADSPSESNMILQLYHYYRSIRKK